DAADSASITTLTSPTPETAEQFGLSVAVSGTTVVVGAPNVAVGDETALAGAPFEFTLAPVQPYAGSAYVFDATDGSLITTLASPNPQNEGGFGWSVAVSGTTVVVGAPFESAGNPAV